MSTREIHQDQKRISEKTWKANFYKYGYFRKSGKHENDVSEIQEEPDEDYEENFSKILNKALDFGNPIQTEGIEVEEIDDSDINLQFENMDDQPGGRRGHALSEIEPRNSKGGRGSASGRAKKIIANINRKISKIIGGGKKTAERINRQVSANSSSRAASSSNTPKASNSNAGKQGKALLKTK